MKTKILITAILSFCLCAQSLYAYDAQEILKKRQEKNKLAEPSLSISKLDMHAEALYQAQTAVGYVTTILMPEPPLKVFLGDQQLFKAEIYDECVAVKPATEWPGAQSNITVFTKNYRLALQLCVGPAETADFVLDFSSLKYKSLDEIVKELTEKKKIELDELYCKKETDLKEETKAQTESEFAKAIINRTEYHKLYAKGCQKGLWVKLSSITYVGNKSYLLYVLETGDSTCFTITGAELRKYVRNGEGELIQSFRGNNTTLTEEQWVEQYTSFETPELKNREKVVFKVIGKLKYSKLDWAEDQKVSVIFRWIAEK